MARKEKLEGHAAEHSKQFHAVLKEHFGFTAIEVGGESSTKTDFKGVTGDSIIRFSGKYASGKSTQVWLPTQKTLFEHVEGLAPIKDILIQWLGTVNTPRKSSVKITDWQKVIDALNNVTKNKTLLEPMMLRVGEEEPIQYITWIGKVKGGIQIIDAANYVDYISENASWKTSVSGRGESLILVDNKTGDTLIHLQRKGSGTPAAKIAPLFHIHKTWPKEVIVINDDSFKLVLE